MEIAGLLLSLLIQCSVFVTDSVPLDMARLVPPHAGTLNRQLWFLKVTHAIWGHHLINDVEVRRQYRMSIARYSREMEECVRRGQLSLEKVSAFSSRKSESTVIGDEGSLTPPSGIGGQTLERSGTYVRR